jgi:hypothetical protein
MTREGKSSLSRIHLPFLIILNRTLRIRILAIIANNLLISILIPPHYIVITTLNTSAIIPIMHIRI